MFKAPASKSDCRSKMNRIPPRVWGGLVVWCSLLALRPPLAAWILAFGPTVIVPLGLLLFERQSLTASEQRLVETATWLLLPTSAALVVSLWFEQSLLAAGLAVPWLLTTLLLAAAGGLKLWLNGLRVNRNTTLAAALLLLPVGAGWAVLSRAGLQPQGFSHEIVLLTGVHFHYAGFALPLLTAAVVAHRPTRWQQLLIATIVAGVPAVGVGISLSPVIEVVAAMVLAIACLVLAVGQAREALQSQTANVATLLLISSTSISVAMVLAGVYAVGEFTELRWLSIPAMIQTHGALNAFGFAFCGLLARVIARSERST